MASRGEAAPTAPGRGVGGKPHPHQLQLPQLHVSIHPSTNRINGRLLQVNIQAVFVYRNDTLFLEMQLFSKPDFVCDLAGVRSFCIRQVN